MVRLRTPAVNESTRLSLGISTRALRQLLLDSGQLELFVGTVDQRSIGLCDHGLLCRSSNSVLSDVVSCYGGGFGVLGPGFPDLTWRLAWTNPRVCGTRSREVLNLAGMLRQAPRG